MKIVASYTLLHCVWTHHPFVARAEARHQYPGWCYKHRRPSEKRGEQHRDGGPKHGDFACSLPPEILLVPNAAGRGSDRWAARYRHL